MATSITCCGEGFRLKPQKVHTLTAFSLPFLFSPPRKSHLSRWACSGFIMAPLCAGSPLFLGFTRLSKCSCFWGQGPYQVIVSQLLRSAMKSPSSVAEHLRGVRPVTAGRALLCHGKALTTARETLVHFLCAKTFLESWERSSVRSCRSGFRDYCSPIPYTLLPKVTNLIAEAATH